LIEYLVWIPISARLNGEIDHALLFRF